MLINRGAAIAVLLGTLSARGGIVLGRTGNQRQSSNDRLRKMPYRPTVAGRNEPCPCGSGKKHKKCCLHKGE